MGDRSHCINLNATLSNWRLGKVIIAILHYGLAVATKKPVSINCNTFSGNT